MFNQNAAPPSNDISIPGAYSLVEILSQPQCWKDCLRGLETSAEIREINKEFGKRPEWLFIGCGSSYYVAMTAAASWSSITGTRARAVPASELLLFPELVLPAGRDFVPVLISRSGNTSEVLRAAQYLRENNVRSIGISCAPGQKLEKLSTISLLLPAADEQSTVMTRSFTSMLLALQYLAASLAGKTYLIHGLTAVPDVAEKMLDNLPARMREFFDQRRFADYVCLGQGPYYGLACESSLKLTEMSCSYGQSFHTLEFRHGPKSIVSEDTLISFLLSASDLYSGMNLTTPGDLWKKDWWYRTTFNAPAGRDAYSLIFKGINYRADVWLNGQKIADKSQAVGMYNSFEFDVSKAIRPGQENVLAVKITPERAIPGEGRV